MNNNNNMMGIHTDTDSHSNTMMELNTDNESEKVEKKGFFARLKEKREAKKEEKRRIKERNKILNEKRDDTIYKEEPLSNDVLTGKDVYDPLEEKKKRDKRKKFLKNLLTIPELLIVILLAVFLKSKYIDYSKNAHQTLNYTVDSYLYTIERDADSIIVLKDKKKACPIPPCEYAREKETEIKFSKMPMTLIKTFLDIKFLFQSTSKEVKITDIKTGFGRRCIYSLINNDESFLKYNKFHKYKVSDYEQMSSYTKRGYLYVETGNRRVLSIAMGEKPTGGYSLSVTNIYKKGNDFYVYVKEQQPNAAESSIALLTHPVISIVLDEKPEKIFVYNVENGEEYYNYESLPQNREINNKNMTSIAGELIKSVMK